MEDRAETKVFVLVRKPSQLVSLLHKMSGGQGQGQGEGSVP